MASVYNYLKKYHPKSFFQKHKNQLRIIMSLINGLEQLLDKVQTLTAHVREGKKRNVIQINLTMTGGKYTFLNATFIPNKVKL